MAATRDREREEGGAPPRSCTELHCRRCRAPPAKPTPAASHLQDATSSVPNRTYTIYTPGNEVPPSSRRRSGRRRKGEPVLRRRRGGTAGWFQKIASTVAEKYCINDDLIPKKPLGSNVFAKTVRGIHVFEISGYSLLRERPRDCGRAASAVFSVGGYDWQIVLYLGGFQGDNVAAFLVLPSEDKGIRVRASFHLSLLDVTGSTPPYTMSGANEFDPERSVCSGNIFKKKSELEASPYLHDDCLTIECVITVEDVNMFTEVPPLNTTDKHLGKLLQGKEDTDVIFDVEGEAFPAHKTVLAMWSPVFKAELYGAMRENDMNRISIGDMQAVVFETLLQFIYTDSLPSMDDLGRSDYNETIRHLLVAADRYAIDRLKIICEIILCQSIDVTTVMTTLALADQHHCSRLNDGCLQFIATLSRTQLDDVMATQWYAELKANSPLALVELWEKASRIGRSNSSFHFGS